MYVHAPIEGYEGFAEWPGSATEALLYDFNAKEGDTMTVVGSCGGMIPGKVVSAYTQNVNGKESKAYTIKLDIYGVDITVVEGLGNISFGCMPFYIESEIAGGGSLSEEGSMAGIPAPMRHQELYRVTDLDGNVICEKTGGKWPWEIPDGVSSVEAEGGIAYDGNTIEAPDSDIAVIDLSGKRVADGFGSVSTAGLQPGVYVAKTAGQSLKIVVR